MSELLKNGPFIFSNTRLSLLGKTTNHNWICSLTWQWTDVLWPNCVTSSLLENQTSHKSAPIRHCDGRKLPLNTSTMISLFTNYFATLDVLDSIVVRKHFICVNYITSVAYRHLRDFKSFANFQRPWSLVNAKWHFHKSLQEIFFFREAFQNTFYWMAKINDSKFGRQSLPLPYQNIILKNNLAAYCAR